jgi:hypothetical protein
MEARTELGTYNDQVSALARAIGQQIHELPLTGSATQCAAIIRALRDSAALRPLKVRI